jgi:fructokinase
LVKTDTETDIVAVGECLIDFGSGQRADTLVLEGHPGGAPANVLAMAAKLRCSTQMIAKVGTDAFGSFLIEQLKKANIGTAGMVQTKKEPTTLAIVSLDTTGNRSFTFYRNRMADVQLTFSEIDKTLLKTCKLFHFGSVSLTSEPARSATLKAAIMARKAGALISYDPNLRAPLWEDLGQAKEMILEGMHLADVVKLSGEELEFLSSADLRTGMELLYQEYKMRLLTVTLGPGGCVCRMKQGFFTSATFDVSCVDTTGAGDAFWGAVLARLLKTPTLLENDSPDQIHALLDFANAAGALATTKKGAIPAMPDEEHILKCIETMPRCRRGSYTEEE